MRPEDLLAHFSEEQTAGFILVLARISPLFTSAKTRLVLPASMASSMGGALGQQRLIAKLVRQAR